jgi:NAD+-dependent protein deacetylase SIR2
MQGPRGGAAKNGRHKPKASSRVNALIRFDEEDHQRHVKDDIEHGVAHELNAVDELEEHVKDMEGAVWENESLFEDALEEIAEDNKSFKDCEPPLKIFTSVDRLLRVIRFMRCHANVSLTDPDACTLQESVKYRQQLRRIGPEEFCRATIDNGLITAKRLLTAFGIRPPDFLDGAPDESYLALLSLAMLRELSKRAKLLSYNTVDDAVHLLQHSKNIIVLTGAGISTSLGIPDFRSKGTGLYAQLDHLGLSDPQEVFDIRVFKDDPTIFYSVAKDIIPSTSRYTPTHAFIALLQAKGKLLTNYSQNIDNLEAKAGILPEKLVQCHGSFATASCVKCGHKVDGETIFPDIRAGTIPRCAACELGQRGTKNSRNTSRKRKLAKDGSEKKVRRRPGDFDSNSDSEFDSPAPGGNAGIMKPDITFFGEPLPDTFSKRLTTQDKFRADLCVVIGTSLKVAPVSEVVSFLPPNVPQIYISRTPVSHVNFDIDLLGDCDVVVAELCRRAGWDLSHDMIPPDQVVDVKLQDGFSSRFNFSVVHPKTEKDDSS